MHIRRLAAFLLGTWLSCSFFMILVQIHNLSGADRLAAAPPRAIARSVEVLGPTAARAFLRIQGLELNRWYAETWEWAQLVLGALLLASLLVDTRRRRVALGLCLLMMLIVVVKRFAITPRATQYGRVVDALPSDRESPYREMFRNFDTASTVTETVKDIFGLMLLSSLLRQHGRHRSPEDQKTKWVRTS